MRKYLLLLAFISAFLSCKHEMTNKELAERISKIRTALINAKTLPPAFRNQKLPVEVHDGRRYFLFQTTRKENNAIDTVKMDLTIKDSTGSFNRIDFCETHLNGNPAVNGGEGTAFAYGVNNEGILDWAYYTEPPIAKPDTLTGQTIMLKGSLHPIIEINLNSTKDSHEPTKTPDEKTKARYMDKLKTTLDELDKVLSIK